MFGSRTPRSRWFLTALSAFAISATFTMGTAPLAFSQEKVLPIGVLAPLTGSDALTGANMKNAVELAFAEVNYKVGDYKIELHWIDEGGGPASATSNYEEAIVSDKIQAGMLGYRSDNAVALIPLVSRYKVPHLFGMGATELINKKFQSDPDQFGFWTTKCYPIPGNVSGAYADAIGAAIDKGDLKVHARTVAVIAEEDDWGRSVATSMKKSFQRNGWDVKSVDYFPADLTDFTPLLARLKDLDVSIVAATASVPQSAAALAKQYRSSALKPLLILDGLGYDADWYKQTGKASNNVLDQHFLFASADAKKFASDFLAKAGFNPSPLTAGLSYDVARFFIEVLKRTDELNHEINKDTIFQTVKDEVWTGKLTYAGIMNSNYAYDPKTIPDPIQGPGYYVVPVVQYHSGESVVVWPQSDFSKPISFQ